jgi:CDP-glucose 4,6-dehydratase
LSKISDFYYGKKVLVTGHTGFKGSWLSKWLTIMGSNVLGYALEPNTDPSLYRILKLEKDLQTIIADIRDYERLLSVIREFKPDLVFHLASQAIVRRSYKEPRLTFDTNLIGTVNLLEAIRTTRSVKAVVNITSDKCYENKEWVWGYRETDEVGGRDPYSASKGCSELITASYRRAFFQNSDTALATARAGNIIGGGDWAEDRLIPDIVRSLSDGEIIIVRNPGAIRPWQHVLEPLSGYLLLGKLLYQKGQDYAEAWNFGPNEIGSLRVEDVVKKSIEIWGHGSYKIQSEGSFPESRILRLDISKALTRLDWHPIMTSEKAIKDTLQWYALYYTDINAAVKMVTQQIEAISQEREEL